jgi:hypothetical protein
MIDAGDIYIADIGRERRTPVLVLSVADFTLVSRRVLIAPAHVGQQTAELPPWHIPIDGRVFSVDRARTVRADRLLDRVGRAPASAALRARRAIRAIT